MNQKGHKHLKKIVSNELN